MIRLVAFGDGFIAPPFGFGEMLIDMLHLKHPSANLSCSLQGEDRLSLSRAWSELPFHVIGKAPQKVILSLGATELEQGASALALWGSVQECLTLIQNKTHAKVIFVTPPSGFFVEGKIRAAAQEFEDLAQNWASPSTVMVATSKPVATFLQAHRENEGEKRALHLHAAKPTAMGRLLIADWVFNSVDWGLI